jgi:hypothetical protein
MNVREEMTTDAGKVVKARIIVDPCGPVVGVGVVAVVGRVVNKGILYMDRKTMVSWWAMVMIIAQATGQDSINVNNVSTRSEYANGPSDYTPFSVHVPALSRFAGRFGLNLDMMQSQQPYLTSANQYGIPTTSDYGNCWDGQWNEG